MSITPSTAASVIEVLGTGIVSRNEKPHVRSIHSYFPSLIALDNGELLCSVVMGEAFEAVNCRTHLARSVDGGQTWEAEGELYPEAAQLIASNAARLTALPNGETLAFMVVADRSEHPDEGLASHLIGFVPTELLLLRSFDYGRNWNRPEVIEPPLVGPSFEMCAPITPLRDGRWVLPTSTWRGWDGDCPNGMRAVGFVSPDKGKSWPTYMDVMHDPNEEIIYWESKIVELADGRLLDVAWAYNEKQGVDLPNQYSLSDDGGASWSAPRSMGLQGQTLTPLVLPDGRVLCVYRRMDTPGLWANISRIEGANWINESDAPLWGANVAGLTSTTSNMAHNFNVLRFGAPCLTALPDGNILATFWCYEDCISVIRWIKLNINDEGK